MFLVGLLEQSNLYALHAKKSYHHAKGCPAGETY